jgi:hypothetical protein
VRKYIALSTFGFYKGGSLEVKLRNFHSDPYDELDVVSYVMYSHMLIITNIILTEILFTTTLNLTLLSIVTSVLLMALKVIFFTFSCT